MNTLNWLAGIVTYITLFHYHKLQYKSIIVVYSKRNQTDVCSGKRAGINNFKLQSSLTHCHYHIYRAI